MTNREELEKMFDEKINTLWYNAEKYIEHNERLKKIFFETIIPEVLKSIIPWDNNLSWQLNIDYIKRKAKELYNIKL